VNKATVPQRAAPPSGRPTSRPAAALANNRIRLRVAGAAVVAVLVLAGLYLIYRDAGHTRTPTATAATGSGYPYAVGQPGPGSPAPAFSLAATTGGQISLASLRGTTVLLYFQEGLSCQPCWDQLTDLEKHAAEVKAAGVEQVVSITTDPVDLITTKVHDMHLSTPVLSDPDLTISTAYHANQFGMMGTSRDGHTFILVKPDGSIAWRADYGGAPKYTMFVPTAALLTDLHTSTAASPAATP
jgi:peroxiredoxin Q/BCP